MLLSNQANKAIRWAMSLALFGALALASACTVKPLLKNDQAGLAGGHSQVSPSLQQKLAAIAINAPTDRFNQLVRNHLIFLLSGGKGQSASPTYRLAINTQVNIILSVQVDIGDYTERTGRASVGTVWAHSNYVLSDLEGKALLGNKRSVSASFDRPRQEYANLAAEENAKRRAAEELAEQIFLSLAQQVSKL